MNQKIYFAASIRGGRNDAEIYHHIIAHLKQNNTVLTEHIGMVNYTVKERGKEGDRKIYEQDMSWLKEADLVIAECSTPSLGVGYELATAEKLGKPVFIFYRKSLSQLSAMLTGDDYFHIFSYETEEELYAKLDEICR